MPYVYPDPILSGVNPFAQPMAPQPVPAQTNGLTQPMPVRPGSGQAVNTQGTRPEGPPPTQTVTLPSGQEVTLPYDTTGIPFNGKPIDFFDDESFKPTGPSLGVQEYVEEFGTTELPGFEDTAPFVPNVTPQSDSEAIVTTQSSGFEIIGLIAIASLIAYLAR